MNKDIKNMVKVAENLSWSVEEYDNYLTFGKYSPQGQDFSINITAEDSEDVINEIKERCNNFDCSYETYLWLDNTGHGANDAPYDMKDVYEDMEACLEMMEELLDELENIE